MNRHYNKSLFWIGFMMNMTKNIFLLIPGLILCIIGIWVKPCLFIGAALLVIDVVISLIEQIRIKKTVENNSDPNFESWAEIMSKDNFGELMKAIDGKIKNQKPADADDNNADGDEPAE